nr:MAG TPA: hypothetical protein [Caudoviricetes sp.]
MSITIYTSFLKINFLTFSYKLRLYHSPSRKYTD